MSKLLLDRRAFLVTGAATTLLAACGGNLIGPPEASPLYVLRPPVPPPSGAQDVRWQLSVVLPEAAQSLDTDRIALIQPTGQMDYYANSAWQDRLPFLIQSSMIEAFEGSGRVAVGHDTDGLRSDYLLHSEIRDFQARYDVQDAPPTAVVRIAAKLITARGRTIASSYIAREEVATTQNSVPAVVQAFNQALGKALQEITDWALNAPKPPPAPV